MEVQGKIKKIGEVQTFGNNGFRKREVAPTADQTNWIMEDSNTNNIPAVCVNENCQERRASLRNEISIIQKALADSINQNEKVSELNFTQFTDLLLLQLNEEVTELKEERDHLLSEMKVRD